MVGEIEVEPEFADAWIVVTVYLAGDGCRRPLEGATVEIFSSRNTHLETMDVITQPEDPTDAEGKAWAYIDPICRGEAHITAAANRALLCESWEDGECVPLVLTIFFDYICYAPLVDCGCECVDVSNDINHCGGCDLACSFANAAASCVDSVCMMDSCDAGWDDCNVDPSDGCEANLRSDPQNCGSCGNACLIDQCFDGSCEDEDFDVDGDGCISDRVGGDDCDDRDPDVCAGFDEICDGKDNDCDGETDEGLENIVCDDGNLCTLDRCQRGLGCVNTVIIGYPCDDGDDCTERDGCNESGLCSGSMVDADEDGHAPQPCGGDCDDADPGVYPGVVEDSTSRFVCADGRDNDCDGLTDHQESGCCDPDCTGAVCGDGGCPDQPVVCGECLEGFFCAGGSCEEITDQVVWIQIPGGSFMMGSDDGPPMEQPVHQVDVPGFYMTMTEVTVSQYQSCVDTGPCWAPSQCSGSNWGVGGREDHPLNCASWFEASFFCGWIGGRLPSEAEWEYAARGGGLDVVYPWGNDAPTCDFAVYREDTPGCGEGSTWPVCSKPAGKTAQGLCNMAGNVCEMVQDYHHGDYTGAPADGSAWEDPVTSTRAIRGGDYLSGPDSLRTTFRGNSMNPGSGFGMVGFRCVRSTAPPR